MKLGVEILAYNVSRFIGPVIENAGLDVDRIYIAYSPRAWGYNPDKRNALNPTTREELLATRFADKTVVIDGDWPTEEDARNACLERARQDGCDYLLVQDADEFFPEEGWAANKAALAAATERRTYKAPWYNLWKTPEYVIEYADGTTIEHNATYAVPCDSDVRFVRNRITSAGHDIGILPGICFHFGYVHTDEEMLLKISTWGHTAEAFNLRAWYRFKWLGWTPETKNLNVIYPSQWRRAVRFEGKRPDFGASLEVSLRDEPKSRFHSLGNWVYDSGVALRVACRSFKRSMLLPMREKTLHWLKPSRGPA